MALGMMPTVVDFVATGRPSPCVDIQITGIASPFVSLDRVVNGEAFPVRGARNFLIAGTTAFFTDYEVPFGVPVTYRAYTSAAKNGAMTDQIEMSVSVAVDDCWISDPFVPALSRKVLLSIDGVKNRTYRADGSVYSVEGSSRPVAVYGRRGSAQDVPMTIICSTYEEADGVLEILSNSSPVLLRAPTRLRFTPLAYFVAPTISEDQIDIAIEDGATTHFSMSITIVKPPSADIVVPIRTYEDVLAENSTYSDLLTKGTYLAVLRGY